jgi:hypothetical protein
MPKLCPKIILEGTRLTHKTDIAFALNEHPRIVGPRKYRYHSPLISAEWCAFTNVPWGRGLINFESCKTRIMCSLAAFHKSPGIKFPAIHLIDDFGK